MVEKKQFDMTMGGDQESDSASSLTITITNVKIELPDQGTIMDDADASQPPEGAEDATDMSTPGSVTDEEEIPSANDGASATVPVTAGDPDTQTTQPKLAYVQVNPNHMNFLLNLPCALTDQLSILDDAYAAIMDTFFLHIWVRHAESLGDLNTSQAAVNKSCSNLDRRCFPADWISLILSRGVILQSSACVCKCCDERLTAPRRSTLTRGTSMLRRWAKPRRPGRKQYERGLAKPSNGNPNGNHAPWLAQVTAWACDFQLQIMWVVADYLDIPMKLWCAAILQQLDMFLSTTPTLPWTCPLSYPVPAECLEAKVPPTPTHMSKGSSKSSDGS